MKPLATRRDTMNHETRDAMMVSSDARAIGMVTGLRRGHTTHKPRTRTIALSECVSYNPRNGQTIDDATIFTPTRTSANKSRKIDVKREDKRQMSYTERLARFGAIGDND